MCQVRVVGMWQEQDTVLPDSMVGGIRVLRGWTQHVEGGPWGVVFRGDGFRLG